MAREPTTSTYALLGLLALRPWTAYELTQQMRRALRWVWLRSESTLYAEIRRLDELGFARGVEEETQGRTRTRYEITDAGREALRAWLAEEAPVPPRLQVEQVLRVFLADLGEAGDLRRSLDRTRQQVGEIMEETLPILEQYAGSDPPFPGRAHLNVLFIHFMAGFLRHVLAWCDDVEAELDSWPGTADVGETPGTRRLLDDALAFYRSHLAASRGLDTAEWS